MTLKSDSSVVYHFVLNEITNFGILDGVEHMKERNDDDEDE